MKTKAFFKCIFLCISLLSFTYSCELLEEDVEEETTETTETTSNLKPAYEYTFTCPSGTKSTVPIPKGTEKCQKAYEYYAKTYGCNNADYFNQANCRMCSDCGFANNCSVCN